jgi:ABC-type multidrug transport system fused ATPase/permease subunit
MIKSILRLLNDSEKKHFNYIFILLCINSIFELVSLAVFYPTLSILFDENYDFTKIDNLLNNFDIQIINFNGYLYLFFGLIFIIFLIKNVFFMYFIYKQNQFVREIRIRTSSSLIDKYIYLSYPVFFKKTLPNILRNIDLSISFSAVTLALITFFSEIIIFTLLIIFLLSVEFKLTIAIIIIILLLIYLFKRLSKKKFYNIGVKSQRYAQNFKKELLQIFTGIREIKILKKEEYFNKKFYRINKLEANNNFLRDVLLQLPRSVIELLVVLSIISLIFTMFFFEYEKSEILIFISLAVITSIRLMPAATRIVGSLQRLTYYQPLNQILISEIYNKLATTKSCINKYSNKYLPFKNEIIFSDVSFSYDLKKPIINKLNLKIKKNSCFGIIGESGSGKSTITDLVMGLIEPTAGKIKIDKNFLKDNINLWKNNISYVSQSPFFLNDTIEKNIAFGQSENKIDKKLVIDVSKKVKIFDHINKLKYKFKTNVGEGGIKFSGGQLQRIAIARALYRKSDVLILDEATNSLDNQSEIMFFKFLKTLKKKLTIIIITHKVENISICDQILKIKKI